MTDSNRDLQILTKICGYCRDIDFTHAEYNRDYAVFCSSPTYHNAIALCLMQIGELVKKLSADFTETHTNIPWRAIRGMRNVVAHEYGNIDLETVWETAETGTTELKTFCEDQLRFAEQEQATDFQQTLL